MRRRESGGRAYAREKIMMDVLTEARMDARVDSRMGALAETRTDARVAPI